MINMSREEQLRYFHELRPYLIASVLLFCAAIGFGFLSAIYAPAIAGQLWESIAEFLKGFLSLPKLYLALAIFLNNVLKTFLAIVLGILFGVLPLFSLLLNGFALGAVLYLSIQSQGIWAFWLAIAPHGLFELPAVVISDGIGLMLGVHAIQRLFGNTEMKVVGEIKRALRFFATVIVPLLLLAALIEAFVTSVAAA